MLASAVRVCSVCNRLRCFDWWNLLVVICFFFLHQTFDDADFHFATAAMETVDRSYCWGIDDAHHNITDGHVAHHLFFTKIPHYNLKKATAAIRPHLKALGVYR